MAANEWIAVSEWMTVSERKFEVANAPQQRLDTKVGIVSPRTFDVEVHGRKRHVVYIHVLITVIDRCGDSYKSIWSGA